MALITDMNTLDPDGPTVGHINGTTLNIPMTKDPEGNVVPAISYGAAVCFGTNGSISVQQIVGYEQVENIHPATYQRIDIGDGNGFADWLKIG
jgi:hypothetical protein